MPSNSSKNKKKFEFISAIDCMPKDAKSIAILHERSKSTAAQSFSQETHTISNSYIKFFLGKTEQYGIDYQYAKEIISHVQLTALPCSPHFIAGIINRRGALVAVIDLKKMLYRQSSEYGDKTSIIIVNDKHITVGILTDHIAGDYLYDAKSLEVAPPSEKLVNPEFISGLHVGKVAIINISAIITESQSQLSRG
jgi:purine-binding chemotaxis protein CheW